MVIGAFIAISKPWLLFTNIVEKTGRMFCTFVLAVCRTYMPYHWFLVSLYLNVNFKCIAHCILCEYLVCTVFTAVSEAQSVSTTPQWVCRTLQYICHSGHSTWGCAINTILGVPGGTVEAHQIWCSKTTAWVCTEHVIAKHTSPGVLYNLTISGVPGSTVIAHQICW